MPRVVVTTTAAPMPGTADSHHQPGSAHFTANLRESLRRQFGAGHQAVGVPGLTRKRANSVNASSSRIEIKRLRPLEAVQEPINPALPTFTTRAEEREIILVSEDDDDLEADDGAVWFDYDEPKREFAAETDANRASSRLRGKKNSGMGMGSGIDAKATAKRKKRPSGKGRGKRDGGGAGKRASRNSIKGRRKAKSKPVVESSDEEGEGYTDASTKSGDESDENNDERSGAAPPSLNSWQGPINLEPFDGGVGLPDVDLAADDEAIERSKRLFPGQLRPTEQFWRRRVHVSGGSAYDLNADLLCRAKNSISSRTAIPLFPPLHLETKR